MYKLFGIPNCDTVKKARVYLESKAMDVQFIDFKKTPPTVDQILLWESFFDGLPVNKKGVTYKKYAQEFEKLNHSQQVDFLIKNSSMIKRPILQKGQNVLFFGFNETDYKKILGK